MASKMMKSYSSHSTVEDPEVLRGDVDCQVSESKAGPKSKIPPEG